MADKANGIATADDFRKAAEETNPPEHVVLPKSGLTVLLRRPTTLAVWMLDQRLAELQGREHFAEWREVLRASVEQAFVQPRLSLTPAQNEIHPSWLPEEDQVFVLRWVRGLIAPDGTDLVEKFFRTPQPPPQGGGEPGFSSSPGGRPRGSTGAGTGGGDPALPPVEPARAGGTGGAAG